MLNPNDFITTKQFISLLEKSYGNVDIDLPSGDMYDPMERRRLARIVHKFLLTNLNEEDEDDWSAAKDLKDSYSCRSCLIHIAQVYVKGIMDGKSVDGKKIFDLEGKVSVREAKEVIERTLDKKKRCPRVKDKKPKLINISLEQARKIMAEDRGALLVDVRSNEEHQKEHIEGSINMPLIDLSKNPHSLYEYKDRPIILYCQRGSKSLLAANLLIEAGYKNVYNIIYKA